MNKIEPKAGQESVWNYPRPPRLEATDAHIVIIFNDEIIADSFRSKRILETSHPPVYYIPPEDVKTKYLKKAPGLSLCEWKGRAAYYTLKVGNKTAEKVAWYYADPFPAYADIRDHIAFYASPMDKCLVNDEVVQPQPGDFYGGWITKNIVGPFKGKPGTMLW